MDTHAVAKQLLENQRWRTYLSSEEGAVFEKVCSNKKTWNKFLTNPLGLFDQKEYKNLDYFSDHQESSPALIITSRIRTMIFEQFLPDLYDLSLTTALHPPEQSTPSIRPSPPDTTKFAKESDIDQIMAHVPIDDVYFSLEHDVPLLQKLDKLPLPELSRGELLISTQEEDISNLQHMLQSIAEQTTLESFYQIKRMILEVRPSKSKWASEERAGQEQLYKGFEMVINNLKNYTEHSGPFLKPVQKREAPNYFDIIKHPMDLGTMTKKMKAFQYNSKDEFAKDLYLIWSNCLTYNTHPESIYRKHATAMKKRTNELLKKVPDIHIKGPDDDSDDDFSRIDESIKHSIAEDVSMDLGHSIQEPAPDEPMREQASEPVDDVTDDPDFATRVWKRATYQQRLDLLRASELNSAREFPNRTAIVKTPQEVGMALDYELLYKRKNQQRREHFVNPQLLQMPTDPEEIDVFLMKRSLIPELTFKACLNRHPPPKSDFPGELLSFYADPDEVTIPSMPSMSEYKEFVPDQSSALNMALFKNISELSRIKSSFNKILDTQAAQMGLAEVLSQKTDKTQPYMKSWDPMRLPPANISFETSLLALQHPVAILANHSGFDTIMQGTLYALTEVAANHLFNLGKTLQLYIDRYPDLDPEELFLMSTKKSGLDPIGLESYIHTEVIRYNAKLVDLRVKMESAVTQLDSKEEEEDVEFDDVNDEIMSGNFFSELGIDFLNLQELGFSNIPLELWNRKSDKKIKAKLRKPIVAATVEVEDQPINVEIAPWTAIDPSKQIKLLSTFYSQKLDMTEDEFKPKSKEAKLLVKLAQTGKKRPAASLNDDKKKRTESLAKRDDKTLKQKKIKSEKKKPSSKTSTPKISTPK